ncbi:MAG: hypothetical protein A2539_01835 [Elusimicrobia bacterium RIFOXYD2_FULL_34_15]|nr:MAG: hypothetical protein A2539_01835 [Elusimicrobia bacterium RIFOXYD2_FULL_34_15]
MNNNQEMVRANGLLKKFHNFTAVNKINFSVHKQECFGFLGPNGAGKTTTVRMIYCFLEPSSGELIVLGKNVLHNPRGIKSCIGVCPQENNLDPDLPVWDNLRVFARYFDIVGKEAEIRCEELLHFVGLYAKKNSNVEELSGGMKRRLIIARSLLNKPDLLIMDEPTTGLDPQGKHQVWETIMQLKDQGTTFILTTHYMDEAAHLCDRIVIMDKGEIIMEGKPRELVEKNIGTNVLEIYSANKEIENYIKSKNLNYEKTKTHYYIYIKGGEKELAEISNKFGSEISTLRMANLEDVFLKSTGRELRE